MSDELPEPLVPPEVDLRDFPFMPLEIERLRRSKAWLACKRRPELGFYMLNLWSASWHGRPASSLEDDDDVLADLAMCDPKRWEKLKHDVMHGWIRCNDGRLYHPVVAEKALESWQRKQAQRERGRRGNEVRWGRKSAEEGSPKELHGDRERIAEGSPPRSRKDRKGQGQGQREGQGQALPVGPPTPSRPAGRAEPRPAAGRDAGQGDIKKSNRSDLVDPRYHEVGMAALRTAGLEHGTADYGEVAVWLARGADPDLDIYPTIIALTEKRRSTGPPSSLRYFSNAVLQAMEERKNGASTKSNGFGSSPQTGRRKGFAQIAMEVAAEMDERDAAKARNS